MEPGSFRIAIEINTYSDGYEFKAMVVEPDGNSNTYTEICQWSGSNRKEIIEKGIKSVEKVIKINV